MDDIIMMGLEQTVYGVEGIECVESATGHYGYEKDDIRESFG